MRRSAVMIGVITAGAVLLAARLIFTDKAGFGSRSQPPVWELAEPLGGSATHSVSASAFHRGSLLHAAPAPESAPSPPPAVTAARSIDGGAAIAAGAIVDSEDDPEVGPEDDIARDFSATITIIFDHQQAAGRREEAIESLADTDQAYYDVNLSMLAFSYALQDPDPRLRSAAIDSLALIPNRQAGHLLLQALDDADPQLREDALYAFLDQLDGEQGDGEQARIMLNALGNGDAAIRELAAEALHRTAP